MKTKKLLGALLLLVALATGCGQPRGLEATPVSGTERLQIGDSGYKPFSGCDRHGNRVFVSDSGDIAVTRDPSCPGYLPPDGSTNG